jgi:hypothetical protein
MSLQLKYQRFSITLIYIHSMAFTNQRYETLRDPFKSQSHPLAFTDLDTSALKRAKGKI